MTDGKLEKQRRAAARSRARRLADGDDRCLRCWGEKTDPEGGGPCRRCGGAGTAKPPDPKLARPLVRKDGKPHHPDPAA